MSKPWRSRRKLSRLYFERGLSTHEIADELDCNQSTIVRWMDRHGIEPRERTAASTRALRSRPAPFKTDMYGYESWQTKSGGKERKVRVHRLLAVAEWGFDAIGGMDVHHKNGVPWDNRPENIELLEHSEHSRLHRIEDLTEVSA